VNGPTRAVAMLAALAVPALLPPAAAAGPGAPPTGRCAGPASAVTPAIPWAQRRLAPDRAWLLTRGAPTLVAIVDTGVSARAPALAGAVAAGTDVVSGGRADSDCSGHGTFVAGLLAAQPAAGSGLAGVAPAARLLPIRVTDNPDEVDPAALAAGIRAAADASARVIAVSVSTSVDSPAVRAAVSYAQRRDALVVAAAETSGDPTGERDAGAGARGWPPAYPAALPGVLAVAPIGPDGAPTTDVSAANTPAVAAPGSDLTSIAPAGPGTLTASGHGLAVPFVAGTAALVRSYRPELDAPAVRHRLEATADHPSGRLPDPLLGYGVIDPVAAVATVLPEESGDPAPSARPQPIHVPRPAAADPGPARVALTAAVVVATVAAAGTFIAAAVTRGRRRGWRPAEPA